MNDTNEKDTESKKPEDEFKARFESELVRRLAQAIESCVMDDAAGVLGLIDEDVALLCRMGVLNAGDDGEVSPRELLRFLEQHGHDWYLGRLEVQIEQTRHRVARDEHRAGAEEVAVVPVPS